MIQKYSSVLQRYFVQYLSGFDVAVLKEVVQKISVCSEDISLIMTSFIDTLSNISVKQGKSIVLFNVIIVIGQGRNYFCETWLLDLSK